MKRKANVTDRAKRYRTNRAMEKAGRKGERCAYCGNPETLDDEHINGDESDCASENLVRSCRPCNAEKGAAFARAGIGVRTIQFNPSAARGAQNLAQYLEAVMALKGKSSSMSLPAAIKMMRHTPAEDRSAFASQIWQRRRARQGEVPF